MAAAAFSACRLEADFAIFSDDYLSVPLKKLAPAAGLEPATKRLTAARSTN